VSLYTMMVGLGAFHGLNPGMGWLFAVALGLQEGRRWAVWRAMLPLGVGHGLAVGFAVSLAAAAGMVVPLTSLRLGVGLLLVALGIAKLVRHRHPRYGGMRVGMIGLTVWSFLMASAHGAGIMVLPAVLEGTGSGGHMHHGALSGGSMAIATLLHGSGYLLATAGAAWLVFEKVGVLVLRRAWLNVDAIWAVALIVTGLISIATASITF
jgi:hypothetical protein